MTRYVIDLKELVSCWDYNKNVVDIKEATISSRKKYFWIWVYNRTSKFVRC
jgi:hypothetical protein